MSLYNDVENYISNKRERYLAMLNKLQGDDPRTVAQRKYCSDMLESLKDLDDNVSLNLMRRDDDCRGC